MIFLYKYKHVYLYIFPKADLFGMLLVKFALQLSGFLFTYEVVRYGSKRTEIGIIIQV